MLPVHKKCEENLVCLSMEELGKSKNISPRCGGWFFFGLFSVTILPKFEQSSEAVSQYS